jgi:Tol biopolymer transport system component
MKQGSKRPPARQMHLRTTVLLFSIVILAAGCSPAAETAPSPVISATPPPVQTSLPLSPTPGFLDAAGHDLPGRLLIIRYFQEGNELGLVDLSSGDYTPLFRAPEDSYLSGASASPDGKQAVLAYAAPPPDGEPQYGFTDLYLIPLDGSALPQPFLLKSQAEEIFFNPSWSPDGKTVYFSHFYNATPEGESPDYRYTVARVTLDGASEQILDNAIWPVVSPDGEKLAYLSFDKETFNNELYLADVDGRGAAAVPLDSPEPTVDAHTFTADSQAIIFSMVNPATTPALSWLDRLLGVRVARAHDVPSDWYRVPLEGGTPERLTFLGETALFGDLSPAGTRLAFLGSTGLHILNLDDGGLVHLSEEPMVGTIDWIP